MLVSSPSMKCDCCKQYRGVLRVLHSRHSKITTLMSEERTKVSSHTNYRYLAIACIALSIIIGKHNYTTGT